MTYVETGHTLSQKNEYEARPVSKKTNKKFRTEGDE